MKKNMGFTLIELLGVIILLGLILTIIMPKISNSVEQAKQNSAEATALGYINAARNYYNANVLDTDFPFKDGKNYLSTIDSYIDVSGTRPTGGYITVANNKIVYAKLCVKNYGIIYENSDVKVEGDCSGADYKSDNYVSFVSGASKAYIYVANGIFNSESDISGMSKMPYALIIYVDSNNNVLKTYWGYSFDNVDQSTIENYTNEIDTAFSSMSEHDFNATHYLVLEELSVIFFLENNDFMNYTSQPSKVVNYSQPYDNVVSALFSNSSFSSNISPTIYKTITF